MTKLTEKQMRAKVAKMIVSEDIDFEIEDGNVVFVTDFWSDKLDSDKFVEGEPSLLDSDEDDEDEDSDGDEDLGEDLDEEDDSEDDEADLTE